MWRQMIAALLLCASNVCIHALGTYANLLWVLRSVKDRNELAPVRALWIMLRIVLLLLFLHVMEATVWAAFFVSRRCFPDRETAFYYSLVTYTTLGQGDVLLPRAWRLAGGCEAMIGVLLFGWSVVGLVMFTHYVRDSRVRKYISAVAE